MSNQIRIADTTLCSAQKNFSFKEKLEIARLLERLHTDVIELPEIVNERADILFVRTASSFVQDGVLSVAAGSNAESIEKAAAALSAAKHPSIRIVLPLSAVGMEYTAHRKPPKMLEWIAEAVALAKAKCKDVEFCAVDATRAEPDFLKEALAKAIAAGATSVSLCDSAAEMLPDAFASFVKEIAADLSVPLGVACENRGGLASACAILAVAGGSVSTVKTDVEGCGVPLEDFGGLLRTFAQNYGLETNLRLTELHRTVSQIRWIGGGPKKEEIPAASPNESLRLDATSSAEDVAAAVARLGYDLSQEDSQKVYEEFLRAAKKKEIGSRELEAIVSGTAMQVPSAYTLVSFVVNTGNLMQTTAQITLSRDGKELRGISMGDGPISAAFRAIDQIIGSHFELDDFQIQSVTEGREALGSALVRLRSGGRLFAGSGISTDIIGASIRAYLNAVNKMIYEEEQA